MSFFDKLFGKGEQPRDEGTSQQYGQGQYGRKYGGQYGQPTRNMGQGPGQQQMTDQQAVERYRYLLQTAPPEAIEQAHAEAFSRLTRPTSGAWCSSSLALSCPSASGSI